MIDITPWLIGVQIVNFFILFFLLNKLLFQPVLSNFDKRKAYINENLRQAEEYEQKRLAILEKLEAELDKAKRRGQVRFADLRDEGLSRQKALVAEAEETVHEMTEVFRKKIAFQTENAKLQLQQNSKAIADEIVRKLIEH